MNHKKSAVRKLIQKTGFDLHRYHREADRFAWLHKMEIKTVFDIGANVGQFALEMRERLPQAKIYSFEPIRECCDKLTAAFSNDKSFKAFNYALGERSGKLTMNKSSYTPSSSLLPMAESHKNLFPHTRKNTPEEIRIERLDDVLPALETSREILIKVDTQGYEDKVIAGGIETFRQARVAIMETSFIHLYEGQPLFDDIYQKMKSLGFSYQGALHQKINQKTGEVIFEDAIFVRRR